MPKPTKSSSTKPHLRKPTQNNGTKRELKNVNTRNSFAIVPELRIPASNSSGGAEIRLIRNPRRKRSISAYREHGSITIQIPAKYPAKQITKLIPEMVERILVREARAKLSESKLLERALFLLCKYLPEYSEIPVSVSWQPMAERWGSCTAVDRTIRISDRLIGSPNYVLDYVIVHELVHLRIHDHGVKFQTLLARYVDSDRASAFLEGYECGAHT